MASYKRHSSGGAGTGARGGSRDHNRGRGSTRGIGIVRKLTRASIGSTSYQLVGLEQDKENLHGIKIYGFDLPECVEGAALQQLFESKYGPVVKSHFPVDHRTGRLAGHGKIYFRNEQSVRDALSSSLTLGGRRLKLKPCFSNEDIEKSEAPVQTKEHEEPYNNLYIKNFRNGLRDEQEFVDLFKKFGPITSHKIEKNSDGTLRGVGFVCFQSADDAKRAVAKLHNRDLPNGKQLHVAKYESKMSRPNLLTSRGESSGVGHLLQRPTGGKKFDKVVSKEHRPIQHEINISESRGNINFSKSSASTSSNRKYESRTFQLSNTNGQAKNPPPRLLLELATVNPFKFKNLGAGAGAINLKLPTPEETDSNDCNDGDEHEDAQSDQQDQATDYDSDSVISVNEPKPKPRTLCLQYENKPFQNLYVKNFKGLLKTDEDLHGAFQIFGRIQSVKWRGPDFGYVCFKDPRHAQAAIDALDNKLIGNGRRLAVAKALSKEERKQQKGRNHAGGARGDCEVECLYAGSLAIPIPKDTTCTICGKTDQKPTVILECQHIYCKPCLTEWLTFCIENEELEAIHCQRRNCEETFDHSLVKVLVARKAFIKYDKLLLYNLLQDMDDIVGCTKCGHPISIDLDCPGALVSCKKCGWSFQPDLD